MIPPPNYRKNPKAGILSALSSRLDQFEGLPGLPTKPHYVSSELFLYTLGVYVTTVLTSKLHHEGFPV